jgi:hypothetical protein
MSWRGFKRGLAALMRPPSRKLSADEREQAEARWPLGFVLSLLRSSDKPPDRRK